MFYESKSNGGSQISTKSKPIQYEHLSKVHLKRDQVKVVLDTCTFNPNETTFRTQQSHRNYQNVCENRFFTDQNLSTIVWARMIHVICSKHSKTIRPVWRFIAATTACWKSISELKLLCRLMSLWWRLHMCSL